MSGGAYDYLHLASADEIPMRSKALHGLAGRLEHFGAADAAAETRLMIAGTPGSLIDRIEHHAERLRDLWAALDRHDSNDAGEQEVTRALAAYRAAGRRRVPGPVTNGPIIKPTPDDDRYVLWSSVAEGPVFVGTRADMLDHLGPGPTDNPTERRLKRADLAGTSRVDGEYGWGDFVIFEQRGIVDCSKLGELARAVLVDRDRDAALDLCRPLDGEESVRRD